MLSLSTSTNGAYIYYVQCIIQPWFSFCYTLNKKYNIRANKRKRSWNAEVTQKKICLNHEINILQVHICVIVSVRRHWLQDEHREIKTKLLQAQSKRRSLTVVSNALEGKLIPLRDLNRQTAVNIAHLHALETAVESILSSDIYSKNYKSMLRAIWNNFWSQITKPRH